MCPIRLNDQHKLALATVYEGRLVYSKDVVLKAGSRVLDTGSGTGESRNTTQVRVRLLKISARYMVDGSIERGIQ